jgi:hypothetical protein
VDETEALVEAAPGAQFSLRILEQEASGIYVCAGNTGKDESNGHIQRVLLLKLKESSGLLKSRDSSKEFNGCPAIGGTDDGDAAAASSYRPQTETVVPPSQWQVPAPESWNDLPSCGINSHRYRPGESVSFSTPNASR